MSRSTARLYWVLCLLALLVGLITAFQFNRSFADTLQQQDGELQTSKQELENAARLSTQLAELDKLTINETTATRLEILRHLGLEQNDYDVTIGAKAPQPVGGVTLTQRDITVGASLSYKEALALADKLYNNGKMNLTGVNINNKPNTANTPDAEVQVTVHGTLYGLEKKGEHL